MLYAGPKGLTRVAGPNDPIPGLPGAQFGSLFAGRIAQVAMNNLNEIVFAEAVQGSIEGDGLFLAQPVEEQNQYLHFPQFGAGSEGSAWISSDITLFNATTTASNAVIEIRDDAGDWISTTLNGETVTGRTSVYLPPNGSTTLAGSAAGPLQVGSVTIRSIVPLGGYLLYHGSNGLAAVHSSQRVSGFRSPVRFGDGLSTGLALMGFDEAQTIELELIDESGQTVAAADIPLPAHGHWARLVNEVEWDPGVDLASFSGTIRARSNAECAATLILLTDSEYATLPVTEEVPGW